MRQRKLSVVLGLLSISCLLLALSACGGGANSNALSGGGGGAPLPPAPPNAKAHSVYAVFPPVIPSDQNYSAFNTYVLANSNIAGVTVGLPWNIIESNTTPGSYDFSTFDANVEHFLAAGKIVNLIVEPVAEGGTNSFTPSYVFGASWASSCCNTTPQDVVTCSSYAGNGTVDSGMPVVYEPPFETAYKNFIAAVIQHYNGNGTTPIGYIRFGLVMGGEAAPLCIDQWPLLGAPDFKTAFLTNYVTPMLAFEAAQKPAMQLLANIHVVGDPPDNSYADAEAQLAVQNSMGFGNNGLQQSDINNYAAGQPCNADWCSNFIKYVGTTLSNEDGILLELQTLGKTDPTGATSTGSLTNLLPFAGDHYANTMELWPPDLLLAYDPNYLSTASASAAYAPYASAYAQAIAAYVASH